jgi:hypothetical protein
MHLIRRKLKPRENFGTKVISRKKWVNIDCRQFFAAFQSFHALESPIDMKNSERSYYWIGPPTEVRYFGSERTHHILIQIRENSGKLERIVANLEKIIKS